MKTVQDTYIGIGWEDVPEKAAQMSMDELS
jgi:hypothetical protein